MTFEEAQHTMAMMKYRQFAYKTEADPLYLKWQREEIEKQVWLDKIAEIKQRYAYPNGCNSEEAQAVIDEYEAAQGADYSVGG